MLLQQVRDIITNITAELDKFGGFEYQVSDAGVDILVRFNGNQTVYNGYELAMYEESAKIVDPKAKLEFIIDGNGFHITTKTSYDLSSFIRSVNTADRNELPDNVAAVLITDKLDADAQFDFSILTVTLDGAWSRYDFTHAELVFAAVRDIFPSPNENGVFVFAELVQRSREFFDEIEAETE